MRRAELKTFVGMAWPAFLAGYSLWLWGRVFTGTKWGMWFAAAADAVAGVPGVIVSEPGLLAGPLTIAAGLLIGRALLRRLLPEAPPASLSLAAGLVALSLLALLLGSFGLFRPAWLIGLALAATAAGLADLIAGAKNPPALPRLSRFEVAFFAPWLLLGFITALNPTLFYDALYYHFSLPRLYLLTGSVAPLSWSPYSCFPSGAEMLFGMGLAGGSGLGPQLLLLLVWAAAALALRDTAARFAGPQAALPTLLISVSTITFLLSALLATADPLVLLLSAAGVYCLLGAGEAAAANDRSGFSRWVGAWALMAGGAGGVKYNAWISVMALQFFILLILSRRLGRRGLMTAALAGAAAFVVLLPWPVRSYLGSGNPVMPVPLGGLFPGLPPESWRLLSSDAHGVVWQGGTAFRNLLFPWTMVFSDWGQLAMRWGAAAFIGPAIWAGAPLAWFFRRSLRLAWPLGVYAALGLASSVWMFQLTRFAYPALGAWCVVAGAGIAAFFGQAPRWARAGAGGALAIMAALSLALAMRAGANQAAGFRYLRQGGDLPAYLAARSGSGATPGSHVLQLRASRDLPPDARVLMVGDGTFFFLNRDVEAATFLSKNRLLELLKSQQNDRRVAEALRADGFTHVLVSYPELERIDKYGLLGYNEELAGRLEAFTNGPNCRKVLDDPKTRSWVCELTKE